jgi:hypothetical protein
MAGGSCALQAWAANVLLMVDRKWTPPPPPPPPQRNRTTERNDDNQFLFSGENAAYLPALPACLHCRRSRRIFSSVRKNLISRTISLPLVRNRSKMQSLSLSLRWRLLKNDRLACRHRAAAISKNLFSFSFFNSSDLQGCQIYYTNYTLQTDALLNGTPGIGSVNCLERQ